MMEKALVILLFKPLQQAPGANGRQKKMPKLPKLKPALSILPATILAQLNCTMAKRSDSLSLRFGRQRRPSTSTPSLQLPPSRPGR